MTTVWVTLSATDVQKVLSQSVITAINEPGSNVNRLDGATGTIALVCNRIRGAIGQGNRGSVSLTALSIPPEAVMFALFMIVEALSSAVPQVEEYVKSDGFQNQLKAARTWIDNVQAGTWSATEPTNPDRANSPRGPSFGSTSPFEDLSTDEAQPSGATTVAPALPSPGGLVALPGNGLVALVWNPVPGADTYSVFRGTAAGAESATALVKGLLSAYYADATAVNATPYFYTVQAVNPSGASSVSAEVTATPTST